MFYTYILRTSSNTLYIGHTNNLKRRLEEHKNHKTKSAKYIRYFSSFNLAYSEKYPTRKEAMQREAQLKRLSKAKKEALIKDGKIKRIEMQNKNGSAILIIIILILVLAVAGLGFFFIKSRPTKEISTTPAETTIAASPSPLPSVAPEAIVVFEAAGSFSQAEKDEIQKKVIDPYIDYYAELPDQILLTMTIAKNTLASKDTYPYSAKTIFKNGVNAGFLIMKEGTGVAWWLPECMGSCNLSASFKAKYPEIASKVQ